jgi:hypothetical protein
MRKEARDTSEQKGDPKAYSKPRLIEYGRVEEITKATSGSSIDFGGLPSPKT